MEDIRKMYKIEYNKEAPVKERWQVWAECCGEFSVHLYSANTKKKCQGYIDEAVKYIIGQREAMKEYLDKLEEEGVI